MGAGRSDCEPDRQRQRVDAGDARCGRGAGGDVLHRRGFLKSIKNDTTPPIDIVRAMDMTVPGLIAHEAAKKGGVWLDVPRITDAL